MNSVGNDRLEHIVPFVLDQLRDRSRIANPSQRNLSLVQAQALIIGLNGVQGCGKSTVVSQLQETLSAAPHSLHVVVFSIDDLYLPHDRQVALAQQNSDNPLVQHRGQPSTHDVELGRKILQSLKSNCHTEIPIYDKSAFGGEGDRFRDECVTVPASDKNVDVVILEGWCVGFRAGLTKSKWEAARYLAEHDSEYNGRLGHVKYEALRFVDLHLQDYDVLTNEFDTLIHLDAEDTLYVYDWRLEAEHKLRERTGSGMTDEQVKTFVDGYYPSYELYTEALRQGAFPNQAGKQLRLVLGKDRKVKRVFRI